MDTPAQEASLKKSFKPSWVFAMALGSAIGRGAFILPFNWMTASGLGGALVGLAIGGGLIAILALATAMPLKRCQ